MARPTAPRRPAAGSAAGAILFLLLGTAANAADRNLKPAIWETLRSREEAAQTADVTWQQRSIKAGTAASSPYRGPEAAGETPSEIVLGPDRRRLVFAGERARHEYLSLSFVGDDDGEPVRSTRAFDGTLQQSFSEANEQKSPIGTVRALNQFDEWDNVQLLALVLAVRPLKPEAFGPSPDRWRVEDRTEVIDGVPCVVLTDTTSRASRSVRRIYFDPAREYVPLRFVDGVAGAPGARIDMRYDRDEPPAWIPSSWTAVLNLGPPTSFSKSENELMTVVLGGDVPDETFKIDYPPGTELTTNVPGMAERLIVAENGTWVPLRQARAEASATKTPWPWLLAAGGAAALGGAILLFRRRRLADS